MSLICFKLACIWFYILTLMITTLFLFSSSASILAPYVAFYFKSIGAGLYIKPTFRLYSLVAYIFRCDISFFDFRFLLLFRYEIALWNFAYLEIFWASPTRIYFFCFTVPFALEVNLYFFFYTVLSLVALALQTILSFFFQSHFNPILFLLDCGIVCG